MNAAAAIADAVHKRDGRDWREKRDKHDSKFQVPETSNFEPQPLSRLARHDFLARRARPSSPPPIV